jgi:hypothetical protein
MDQWDAMNDGPYRMNAFSGTRSIYRPRLLSFIIGTSEIDVLMLHVQYDIIR